MHRVRVLRAFSAAAETYDRAARAQALAAARLAELAMEEPPVLGAEILEIGCGSGLLTRRLQPLLAGRSWLATDLSPEMLQRCAEALGHDGLRYRVLDGERPALDERFELIVSNLCFQWFHDLGAALARLRGLLEPGGRLLFSTLGAETFHEWRRCLRAEGLPAPARYPPADGIGARVLDEQRITLRFERGIDFLRNLRETGAWVPPPGQPPLSPGPLRRVLRRFDGAITYHVIHAECRP